MTAKGRDSGAWTLGGNAYVRICDRMDFRWGSPSPPPAISDIFHSTGFTPAGQCWPTGDEALRQVVMSNIARRHHATAAPLISAGDLLSSIDQSQIVHMSWA